MKTLDGKFDAEHAFWDLLRHQHGVAMVKQGIGLGLTKGKIATMVRKGRLRSVCYGIVAATGAPETPEQKMMIGVLIGRAKTIEKGPSAAVFGPSAAPMWDLTEPEPIEDIHVLVTRTPQPRDGYVFHRTGRLPLDEIVELRGIPVTDQYRTYLDMCRFSPYRAISMLRRGLRRSVIDRKILEERILVESRQGRAGIAAARDALERTDLSAARAKSWLEDHFFDLLIQAGYPPPVRNAKVRGSFGFDWEIDLYYPRSRKGIEVSHSDIHSEPKTILKDARKLLDLRSMGLDIMVATEATTDSEFLDAAVQLLGPPPGI